MLRNHILSLLSLTLAVIDTAHSSVLQATPLHRYDTRAADTVAVWTLAKAIQDARLQKRDVFKNSTEFAASWDDVTLFKIAAAGAAPGFEVSGSVQVTCSTCYIHGLARVELHYPSIADISSSINNTAQAFAEDVKNLTKTTIEGLEAYYKAYLNEFLHLDFKNASAGLLSVPPLNVSFDMNMTALPQISLNLELDGLEVYMDFDAAIEGEASYEINLIPPGAQPLGFAINKHVQLGVTLSADLILSAEAALNMRGGFHVKFEDGLGFNMALFGSAVSRLINNGAKYESLPISVVSAGVVLRATLRLGLHAGIELEAEALELHVPGPNPNLTFSAGIDTGIYADIVSLTSNITHHPEDKDCKLQVVNGYEFAVGAAAGASLAVLGHTWGPGVEARVPLYTKTFGSKCVLPKVTPTSSVNIEKRDDLVTSSTTITRSYTAVQCRSKASDYCPASLQHVVKTSEVVTLTTMLPLGARASWPAMPGVTDKVTKTMSFGRDRAVMTSTSGLPVAYTAPPDNPIIDDYNAFVEDVKDNKKLVIGLSAGLGVPVLSYKLCQHREAR